MKKSLNIWISFYILLVIIFILDWIFNWSLFGVDGKLHENLIIIQPVLLLLMLIYLIVIDYKFEKKFNEFKENQDEIKYLLKQLKK